MPHENPDEEMKLKVKLSFVDTLVREFVRYQTPLIHTRRTASRDAELAVHQIHVGDKTFMWYVGANSGERIIEEPERFCVNRQKPRKHRSYRAGIHRCVGDRLADLQLSILWEEILKRDLNIEILGPHERIRFKFMRGIKKLPVRIAA